jgi:hypothetical protein
VPSSIVSPIRWIISRMANCHVELRISTLSQDAAHSGGCEVFTVLLLEVVLTARRHVAGFHRLVPRSKPCFIPSIFMS